MPFLGSSGAALMLISVGFVDCSKPYLAVVFLMLLMFSQASNYTGFLPNYLDIAPPFAGFLIGATNSLAALAGVIGPLVTEYLTKNVSIKRFAKIFYFEFMYF